MLKLFRSSETKLCFSSKNFALKQSCLGFRFRSNFTRPVDFCDNKKKPNLFPHLTDNIPGVKTSEDEDILKVNVQELVKEKLNGGPVKLVANLPYYITTPIVMKFLEMHQKIILCMKRIYLLVGFACGFMSKITETRKNIYQMMRVVKSKCLKRLVFIKTCYSHSAVTLKNLT